MTTQQHTDGIEVLDSAWIRGGSNESSYVSPWHVATIKYSDFDRQQGELNEGVVAHATEALHRYTPSNPD